ncbi:MAG: glycosyltransferase family 4 protein [Opitutales bacterium]|nr:glycosyltransferase family 4 protein [Opitutales bacterium]
MRILIHSYAYLPSIGGIERSTDLLAREWLRRGHEVRILTQTPAKASMPDPEGIAVARQPGFRQQLEWARWADVVWQNHLSLRTLIAPWLVGKPICVTVQTWLGGQIDRGGLRVSFKRLLLRRLRTVAISEAIRSHLHAKVPVISNPVDPVFFELQRAQVDTTELLFIGRLVSDKGLNLLLDALTRLNEDGANFRLTIAGDGPEAAAIDARIAAETLPAERIGPIQPAEAASRMARCACLVVPSVWAEPLGIVALEGLAVGCPVVVSNTGGLAELSHFGARCFTAGDADSLADAIRSATVVQFSRSGEEPPFALHRVADAYQPFIEPRPSSPTK